MRRRRLAAPTTLSCPIPATPARLRSGRGDGPAVDLSVDLFLPVASESRAALQLEQRRGRQVGAEALGRHGPGRDVLRDDEVAANCVLQRRRHTASMPIARRY